MGSFRKHSRREERQRIVSFARHCPFFASDNLPTDTLIIRDSRQRREPSRRDNWEVPHDERP